MVIYSMLLQVICLSIIWETHYSYDADLEAANIDDFIKFNKKFHKPGNAILTVAGDIEIEQTKQLIDKYFGGIQVIKWLEIFLKKTKQKLSLLSGETQIFEFRLL